MQVNNLIQLSKEWTAFSDITTVAEDTNYFIQNRGADILVALEADSEPPANETAGTMIMPYCTAIYKKGEQNLYLRAFDKGCAVNVTMEG